LLVSLLIEHADRNQGDVEIGVPQLEGDPSMQLLAGSSAAPSASRRR